MNKKAVSMYNARQIAKSNREVADAIREQTKIQEKISENEIKSKDRVDISRDEYEEMKEKIKFLEIINNNYKEILSKFKIPTNIKIIPDSFNTFEMPDPASLITTFVIKFKVDVLDQKEENWY